MGLTVAFARDLAKHAPLSLYCLIRVIDSGDRASLQKATNGQDLHNLGWKTFVLKVFESYVRRPTEADCFPALEAVHTSSRNSGSFDPALSVPLPFTPPSVEMKARPFMMMRQTTEREMLCPRGLAPK